MLRLPMMLDLMSGLGGQSEAFLRDGWSVLRIDNNPLLSDVASTVIMPVELLDPNHWTDTHPAQITYVHASPPCTEFSTGFSSPRSIAQRSGEDFMPNMKLVMEAIRIIDTIRPKYWSIENVKGSIQYLRPILGEPRLIVGSFVYWGNFPLFDPKSLTIPQKKEMDKRHDPLRANHSACVPLVVSEAFLRAMKSQRQLADFAEIRKVSE